MGYREFLTEIANEYGTKYTNIEAMVIYPMQGTAKIAFKKPIQDELDPSRSFTGVFLQWRK